MLEMNLIKILDSDQDPHNNILKTGTEPVLKEYKDMFGMLDGHVQYLYHIVIDESIKPVVHPPWCLHVAMSDNVQRKLEEMAANDIN